MDLTQRMIGIVGRIAGTIRADETVPKNEKVPFILEIDYSDCTLADALQFANANRKIAWATGARDNMGRITPGQVIRIKASSPGVTPPKTVDELLAEEAQAKGISVIELLHQKEAAMKAADQTKK